MTDTPSQTPPSAATSGSEPAAASYDAASTPEVATGAQSAGQGSVAATVDAPASGGAADNALASEIRDGYAFVGPAVDFGAAVVDDQVYADAPVRIPLAVMNRHGLVAGATGTGKTKTLQLMAEQLSGNGVPVFLADIKGDLSGLATAGTSNPKIEERSRSIGQAWAGTAYPTEFLSLGGKGQGTPIRATITAFGPTLLAKVLGLNETQESSLGLVFHYADKNGLALLDLKDLRAVITFLNSDEGKPELKNLGGLSKATAGVILRELIAFEDQGADIFFGEPEFDTRDLLRTAADGKGIITCLELPAVQDRPALFSTFLMWMLADLFHDLPEVGDLDKPKLVFFFDEAHLLFNEAPRALLEKVEQVVRLVRSKGVGVYFVTQNPLDVPETVLGQLGNRVQHALRAFTPRDQKAVKTAADTFRPNPDFDCAKTITQLGTGEALLSMLEDKGIPGMVQRTLIRPPASRLGAITPQERQQVIAQSPISGQYDKTVDRESAFEMLQKKAQQSADAADAQRQAQQPAQPAPGQAPPAQQAPQDSGSGWHIPGFGDDSGGRKSNRQSIGEAAVKSVVRSVGSSLGRALVRGILGSLTRR